MRFCNTLIFTVLCLCVACLANCQSTENKQPKPGASLEEQATFFVKTIVAFDMATSIDYYLPAYVESMGGREAMLASYKKDIELFTSGGTKLSGGRVFNPTPYAKCNGTVQCVLQQEVMLMERGSEPFPLKANLIAVSEDEGKTWKFLLPGEDSLATLRQSFPVLCESLVLQKY